MKAIRFLMSLTMMVIAAATVSLSAQQIKREIARPIDSVEGVDLYNAYCAVCHGKDAKGTGPAASVLKVRPPDLTTISARNKGQFPAAVIRETILGTERMVPAHGSPDMPMWGPVFRAMSDNDGRTLRVTNLVKYIEGLQQK
jgi:mono/diheme cytochrome c family protein